MSLRNTWIRIKSPEHAQEFQEYVFKLGYEWVGEGQFIKMIDHRFCIFIRNNLHLGVITDLKSGYKEVFFEEGVILFPNDHIVDVNNMVTTDIQILKNWQPIATAPIEQKILVYSKTHGITISYIYFHPKNHGDITHWMSLPKTPTEE